MADRSDERLNSVENRIASLEVQVGYIGSRAERSENKLDPISERLTRLEERVAHLPSKEFIWTTAGLVIGLATAIVTLQGKVQAWLGFLPPR